MLNTAYQAVESVLATFQGHLGYHLESFYLYGSLAQSNYQPPRSDVNLLAVVSDHSQLHDMRLAYRPIWQIYRDTLKHSPLVFTRETFKRHMSLHPAFAHHIATQSEHLAGLNVIKELPEVDPLEAAAHMATEAMEASAALFAAMLPEDQVCDYDDKLARLAHKAARLKSEFNVDIESMTPHEQFAYVQSYLEMVTNRHVPHTFIKRPFSGVNMLVPQMCAMYRAIYNRLDTIILVMPSLAPDVVENIPWDNIGRWLKDQYQAVRITTADQLRLSAQIDTPFDFYLTQYEHVWGADILSKLEVLPTRMLRNAARIPSNQLAIDLPHRYLTAPNESAVRDLLHDFQNQLLNLQLKHELLCHLQDIGTAYPPNDIPSGAASMTQRVDGVIEHLDWWTNYYMEAMIQSERKTLIVA